MYTFAESVRMRQYAIEILKYYVINTKMTLNTRYEALKRLILMCQDESPKVRARSLTVIADCVELFQLKDAAVDLDTTNFAPDNETAGETNNATNNSMSTTLNNLTINDSLINQSVFNKESLTNPANQKEMKQFKNLPWLNLINLKINDERSPVRKSVYKLVEYLILNKWISVNHINLLLTGANDGQVSVRKQCVSAINMLFEFFGLGLTNSWFKAILPGLIDRESSLNEMCMMMAAKYLRVASFET